VEAAFLQLTRLIVGRIELGEITETTPGVKISQQMRIDPIADSGGRKRCC
jgi:hypothetical protein